MKPTRRETRNSKLQTPAPRRAGFTLMEVMIALGIFAIGFVAVAAVFPVASSLQRDTMNDLLGQQASASVEALLQGRRFRNTLLHSAQPHPTTPAGADRFLYPLDASLLMGAPAPGLPGWTLSQRSLPSAVADPSARRFYWVPAVQRLVPWTATTTPTRNDWRIVVFVLRRDDNRQYISLGDSAFVSANGLAFADDDSRSDAANPARDGSVPHLVSAPVTINPANLSRFPFANDLWRNGGSGSTYTPDTRPDQILVGDQFADNNGVVYTAKAVDKNYVDVDGVILPGAESGLLPTRIYYGQPARFTNLSPTCKILTLTQDAVE